MMDFCDGHKFAVVDEWGEKSIIHHRDLGKKQNGLYKDKHWSDVVIHRVYLDDTIYWTDQIEEINYIKGNISEMEGPSIVINYDKTGPNLSSSESYFTKKNIKSKKQTKKSKCNKYVTKPRVKNKIKSRKEEQFYWDINYALDEDRYIEAVLEEEWLKKYDEFMEDYHYVDSFDECILM